MSANSYRVPAGGRRVSRRAAVRGGVVGGAGLAAFALSCGGSDGDSKQTRDALPADPGGSGAAQTRAAPGQPKRGGTMVAAMPKEPTNYDPHLQVDSSKVGFLNLTSNGLVRFKTDGVTNPQSNVVEPDLLAAMPERPDRTTLVLKVRQGVKWHNLPPVNGRAFDAEDIKYNIERMKQDKQADGGRNERAWIQQPMDSVQVVDPQTVRVTFK